MEFVGKILVLLALAGIAAIEVYHKEENTGLMNLILVLIAAVVGWLLPKNDHVLSMIAAVASFAALYLAMADLLKHIDSRYLLVNVIARRARQISIEAETEHIPLEDKPVTIAIHEVADGKLAAVVKE